MEQNSHTTSSKIISVLLYLMKNLSLFFHPPLSFFLSFSLSLSLYIYIYIYTIIHFESTVEKNFPNFFYDNFDCACLCHVLQASFTVCISLTFLFFSEYTCYFLNTILWMFSVIYYLPFWPCILPTLIFLSLTLFFSLYIYTCINFV